MNELIRWDQALFLKINQSWTSPLLDQIFPVLTDLHHIGWLTKIVLPLLLLFWIWKSRWSAVALIVGSTLTAGISDNVSHRLIKQFVQRDRPPIALGSAVELRTKPHAGFSFPSNHAANNFAVATYISSAIPTLRLPLFTIAATVAYSRVYVGVHFPLDVAAGALLGILCGTICHLVFGALFRRLFRHFGIKVFPDPPSHLKG